MNPSAAPAKDFLSVLDLSSRDLIRLIDLAAQVKAERHLADQAPTAHALKGRHVAMLFEKPSLRTRSTFEIAVRELGGHTLQLPEQFVSGGREPLEDIARKGLEGLVPLRPWSRVLDSIGRMVRQACWVPPKGSPRWFDKLTMSGILQGMEGS